MKPLFMTLPPCKLFQVIVDWIQKLKRIARQGSIVWVTCNKKIRMHNVTDFIGDVVHKKIGT